MGVCVKLASADYGAGEIVFYRGLDRRVIMHRAGALARGTVATPVPAMHFWRCLVGVTALVLWFYAIGHLPLATAMTLNYMSSVWMALFLLGGAVALGTSRVDGRLIATVLVGFAGVALILRPTIDERPALARPDRACSRASSSATAYLQVTALGRVGEPEYRIVFYFSIGGIVAGCWRCSGPGCTPTRWRGAALLLAIGVLATAAQLMMTRAYATGPTAGQRQPAVPGHRLVVRLRRRAVRRPRDGDGARRACC